MDEKARIRAALKVARSGDDDDMVQVGFAVAQLVSNARPVVAEAESEDEAIGALHGLAGRLVRGIVSGIAAAVDGYPEAGRLIARTVAGALEEAKIYDAVADLTGPEAE